MTGEKLPPHDIEAEEAVLGSLLVDGEAIYKIITIITLNDFYREKNLWVYQACYDLYERNEAIDQVTVAHEMGRRGRLEAVGGAAYLSHLVSNVATSVHIEHYAQIVHRLAIMRNLISAAAHIESIGYEAGPDVDDSISRAEDVLFRLRHGERPREFVPIRDILNKYFEDAEIQPFEGDVVFTGFRALDDLLGGLRRSDMLVLAARPSLGKTSLALGIARNAAVNQKARVAIFSIEMSRDQLVQRLLASEAGVDSHKLRLGQQTEAEERKMIEATGVLSEAPIYLDDSPTLSVIEMKSKARQLHFERGVDLIIIDYLQLMRGNGRGDNRVQEMTEVSRSIKEMARDLNVPVIAVSQLSRAAEARQSHRPMLSDLRDSGSIEQDADVVVFIYREDIYINEEDWEKQHSGEKYPRGVADIIIAKHRNGPIGEEKLRFLPKTVKFADYEVERA
ncbi:MAG: replicative DNA helicase [Chloroflexota bacterium]|nr:replicative DNA helicase [Chloroflexota bacterium]